MNARISFAAGLGVSALAFGCIAAVVAPAEEAPAPSVSVDVPAVELEGFVTPAPVMTTGPLPLEEAITLEEAPAEEAPLTYEETVALFGEDFAVGDVIVCPAGWSVVTDTTAEGFQWAACQ